MSWGGFAQYANQMMRANREQLKKRKSRNRDMLLFAIFSIIVLVIVVRIMLATFS